jgi:outer membrane protein assembly factor BamB
LSNAARLQPLGNVESDVLAASSEGALLVLDLETGRTLWSLILPSTTSDVLLNATDELVYVANSGGMLEAFTAFDLENSGSESLPDPLWSIELPAGPNGLAVLPQGGVVVTTREGTTAVSSIGEKLWHEEDLVGIIDWAEIGEGLIVLAKEGIWKVDDGGAARWTDAISGQKVVASDHPFVYVEDGIYRIDLDSRSTELFFDLPSGFPRSGDLAELPGGGVLVAHLDLDDKRLIAIDADGSLRWERSIAGLDSLSVELLTLEDEVFMLIQFEIGASTGVDLFHVDTSEGELVRIFSGGTRSSGSNLPGITAEGDSLLVTIPGVGVSVLDPQLALETVLDQ